MKRCWLIVAAVAMVAATAAIPREPALFAEGVVSTADDESGFALAPDGRTAFFGKTSPTTSGNPMQVICVTHLGSDGKWGEPEIAPFSGEFHDIGPAFQPDGSRLFFLSNRPNGTGRHDFNIWYVERRGTGWGEPRALPEPVNSSSQEYGISVSSDGTLYFASNRAGGAGSFDIYFSRIESGEYRSVEKLGPEINTAGPELEPAISPDGNVLVFAGLGRDDERIGVHREYAHGDLYVSIRSGGKWSAARNCGAGINSGAEDSWPGFSSDGQRFFFTSERGFATYRPAAAMTWAQFRSGLTSTLNGMGNIYEVDAAVLRIDSR